jgi:hypothetical protein
MSPRRREEPVRLSEHDAERRVQLVDRPERADAAVQLRHARAVAEGGLASVAAAGVDPRQPNGLVALTT